MRWQYRDLETRRRNRLILLAVLVILAMSVLLLVGPTSVAQLITLKDLELSSGGLPVDTMTNPTKNLTLEDVRDVVTVHQPQLYYFNEYFHTTVVKQEWTYTQFPIGEEYEILFVERDGSLLEVSIMNIAAGDRLDLTCGVSESSFDAFVKTHE